MTLRELSPIPPILGHVVSDAAAVKMNPLAALKEPTPWSEAFRVLRTNMQFVEVDHDKRMFVVSSALPGEGKSTTVISGDHPRHCGSERRPRGLRLPPTDARHRLGSTPRSGPPAS